MHTITLKNIPDSLYRRLTQAAKENHRSINSEIIFYIEQNVQSHKDDPEKFLDRIEELQKQIPLPPLTDDIISMAKTEKKL